MKEPPEMNAEFLLEEINKDPASAASTVGLRYAPQGLRGIYRKKAGRGFRYVNEKGERISDQETLQRIKSLVLPPAWKNVWISPYKNGHLQSTGIDARGRKQYRYHPQWSRIRNQSKFYRLRQFGRSLPLIREQINKDLKRPGLCCEKVLALVVEIMAQTGIRIGNESYKKLYGSHGLTTLGDKHVTFDGSRVTFEFIGKKGVAHQIGLKSKKLANLIRKCREVPGQQLFQYYDDSGKRQDIGSEDVNCYLKQITGEDYTAKDFRAWSGSVLAIEYCREIGPFESEAQGRKNVIALLDRVAERLGNTRTVCKKYYVHPTVIAAYENGNIWQYEIVPENVTPGLTESEALLLDLLDREIIAEAAC